MSAPTPDAVTLAEAASFTRRLLADLVDLALLTGLAALLWRAGVLRPALDPTLDWLDQSAALLSTAGQSLRPALIAVPALGLAMAITLRALLGCTFGEWLLGLTLIRRDGQLAGPFSALLHGLGTMLGLSLLAVGYFYAAIDLKRQGLAEYLSGTLLIRTQPSGLSAEPPAAPPSLPPSDAPPP